LPKSPFILVVSFEGDKHTRAVMAALRRRGAPATLLDLARYPRDLRLTLSYDSAGRDFRLEGLARRPLRLDEVAAIWWRRPKPFVPHREMRGELRRLFCYRECREAFEGLWRSVNPRWVDPPERVEAAEHKPWQLALAQRAGLTLPRTCITSDPEQASAFVDGLKPCRAVFKALSAARADWRETRIVRPEERRRLGLVRYAPIIFQEYVEGVDVRATVVGRRVFAAEIDARATRYPADFRMDLDRARVEPTRLPAAVERAILRLVRALGLSYAAVDLRRDEHGRHFFLEANPGGQWLFVEQRTGQPITEAVASLLATGRP
jgi:hypothetical protein